MGKVAKDAPRDETGYVQFPDKPQQHWNMDFDAEAPIYQANHGIAKFEPMTLTDLFQTAAQKKSSKICMRVEDIAGIDPDDAPPVIKLKEWKSWTWKKYFNDCQAFAKGVIKLGHQHHDSVNIFGFNSPQWFIGMMGTIMGGGKAAGIYPSDTSESLAYKVDQSNGAVLLLEGTDELNKLKEVVDDVPYLKAVVTWACPPGDDLTRKDGSVIKTMSFEQLLELGKSEADDGLEERIAAQKPGHCCAVIYTSGTTGKPKAVMISHDALCYEAFAGIENIKEAGWGLKGEERVISYLPLSHVAGMVVDCILPLITSAIKKGWVSVNFARPYDLKRLTLAVRLGVVSPTAFLGVPRVWEKISERLKKVGAQTKGLKKKLSTKAKREYGYKLGNQQLGGSGEGGVSFVSSILMGVIKGKLGLKKCKYAFSGAAPLKVETLEYFAALGININEVYGMSECTGACTWSTDNYHTWGSVGFELPGTEVKVFKIAEDGSKTECPRAKTIFTATEEEQGEICFRGRNNMIGYLANPRLGDDHVNTIAKKNDSAIDQEGWIHSGDKGCVDVHGMVKITGRYKELIIGAGGENIAPVPIEDNIKRLLPAVSNVMMIGDQRKFNVAILSLQVEGATGEKAGNDVLDGAAVDVSAESKTVGDAVNDPKWIEYITKAIEETNNDRAVVPSNAAKIQKFTIIPVDFSVEGGELTATLKLKRSVVEKQYADIIEKMYAASDTYVKFG